MPTTHNTAANLLIRVSQNISNKALLPVWLIIMVLIILDVYTRLLSGSAVTTNEWSSENVAVQNVLAPTSAQLNLLLATIKPFESDEATNKNNNENVGMSAADQLAQQGDLHELFAKNLRYRLMGVIEQDYRFAVIVQENIVTKQREIINVRKSDKLAVYQIQQVLNNKVTLVGNNKEITLYLYKKHTK